MSSKKDLADAKPKPPQGRGGKRAGSGRKPKAITEMREAVIAPLTAAQPRLAIVKADGETAPLSELEQRRSSAEFAIELFDETMRDESKNLDLRLDCAREVLNRAIGRPRLAEQPQTVEVATREGGVTIYIPDNGRDKEERA